MSGFKNNYNPLCQITEMVWRQPIGPPYRIIQEEIKDRIYSSTREITFWNKDVYMQYLEDTEREKIEDEKREKKEKKEYAERMFAERLKKGCIITHRGYTIKYDMIDINNFINT